MKFHDLKNHEGGLIKIKGTIFWCKENYVDGFYERFCILLEAGTIGSVDAKSFLARNRDNSLTRNRDNGRVVFSKIYLDEKVVKIFLSLDDVELIK